MVGVFATIISNGDDTWMQPNIIDFRHCKLMDQKIKVCKIKVFHHQDAKIKGFFWFVAKT